MADISNLKSLIRSVEDKSTSINNFLNQIGISLEDLKTYTDGLEQALSTLNSKDISTEPTLNQVKLALDDITTYVDELEASLTALNSKDFATQTTLAALNSKDFATQTTLAQVKTTLDTIKTYVDGLEASLTTLNSKDFATQTTLLDLKNIATNILKELQDIPIIFDTTEQFTGINTTVDFTVTLANHAVYDSTDYRKTASCTDTDGKLYTCAYYDDTTKEITFTARPDGSTSTTITVSYQKEV